MNIGTDKISLGLREWVALAVVLFSIGGANWAQSAGINRNSIDIARVTKTIEKLVQNIELTVRVDERLKSLERWRERGEGK